MYECMNACIRREASPHMRDTAYYCLHWSYRWTYTGYTRNKHGGQTHVSITESEMRTYVVLKSWRPRASERTTYIHTDNLFFISVRTYVRLQQQHLVTRCRCAVYEYTTVLIVRRTPLPVCYVRTYTDFSQAYLLLQLPAPYRLRRSLHDPRRHHCV